MKHIKFENSDNDQYKCDHCNKSTLHDRMKTIQVGNGEIQDVCPTCYKRLKPYADKLRKGKKND